MCIHCCKICVYIVVKYVYMSITSKSIGFRVIVINYKIQTQAFLFKHWITIKFCIMPSWRWISIDHYLKKEKKEQITAKSTGNWLT